MKKITEKMAIELKNKFNVTAINETSATIEKDDSVFVINCTKTGYSVKVSAENKLDVIEDYPKMSDVYRFITSFKWYEETETEEAPAEEAPKAEEAPILFYKLNTKEFELSQIKLNLKLSNVLDRVYFERGLAYSMYDKYIERLESIIDKFRNSLTDLAEETTEYDLISTQIELNSRFKSRVIAMRDTMNFTTDEINAWSSDRFLNLVSYAIFGGKLELRNKYNVMAILENVKNLRYSGKECSLSTLKEALNDIALDFATETDETGRYKNSRINVNSTMTEQVWQVYFRGTKLKKNGNFSNENFAKRSAIETEISKQIVGKLQGNIDIED